MNNLISIIVPVYKVEKYLDKCIESIISQTYPNLEIILVDDGSPDKCGEICDFWKSKDNRIKVIHKENGGLSDARNAGIDMAEGDYLAFVDSDDWIENTMYEEMLNEAIKNEADLVMCCVEKVSQSGVIKQDIGHNRCYSRQKALYELVKDDKVNNFAVNKLYRRCLFNELRFPKGRIFEDVLFTYKIFERVNRVVHINKNFYHYLRHENSILGEWPLNIEVEFAIAQQERFENMIYSHPELGKLLITKYMNFFWSLKRKFISKDSSECIKNENRIILEIYPFFRRNIVIIKKYMNLGIVKILNYIIFLRLPCFYRKIYKLIK